MTPRTEMVPASADSFREEGHAIVERLAAYLEAAWRGELPVLPEGDLASYEKAFPPEFEGHGGASLLALVDTVIAGSNHLHHPRYVGHQVTAPAPAVALAHLAAALLNNAMAVFEMGPAATAMEASVLRFLAKAAGYGPGAGGVLTHGGSIGNLTALLAARQAKAGFDIWAAGAHQGPKLALLVSDQAHYCVARSVHIMGWGDEGIVRVPTDAHYRVRTASLDAGLAEARRRGRKVIALVGCAASTATGSMDDLVALADFAEAHDLWFHVDGAHGASLLLGERHRSGLRGIERADSIVWDAHKMMLVPALVTAVLFRDARRSYDAFAQQASYLFSSDDREASPDVGLRTLECTKRMLGFELYAALAMMGPKAIGAYVDACVDLAQAFAAALAREADFEVAVPPEVNIVCFRYVPKGTSPRSDLQERIRHLINASGAFYVVKTTLRDGVFLRITVINPKTTMADLEALRDAVRAAGASLVAEIEVSR